MKKLSFMIALIFLTAFSSVNLWASPSQSGVNAPYISRSASGFTKTPVKINGTYPYFSGNSFNVNQKIQTIINNNIKEAEAASSIDTNMTIGFTVEESGSIVSVLLTTGYSSGSSMEKIDTVVFDTAKSTKEIINITDDTALGKNGIKIANKRISSVILKTPGKYNVDFSGIDIHADFYIKDNAVFLVFDKYEISPGAFGTQVIEVNKGNIKNFKIASSEYVFGSGYNIRMVPLRKLCQGFGYELLWHDAKTMKNPKITIVKGSFLGSLSIGLNEYSKNNFAPVSLEAPPEIRKDSNGSGVTYVPISFAETLLDLFYYVDSSGNLVFSYYEE